jgi:CRP-like cAMP-binding protein
MRSRLHDREQELPMQSSPNHFLRSLNPPDFELIRPHLRESALEQSTVLHETGQPIERVYFPHRGVISLVIGLETGDMIEAGMIGHDGAVGASAALDGPTAINNAIVQIPGQASWIEAGHMRSAVASSESLRASLYRQDQILLIQAQQSAACNAKHNIEERMCRWLLRMLDLVDGDTLNLTQEFLAQMLGVRRTSVTLVASHLQAINLISYRRGHIQIRDREALADASCECYQATKDQVARLAGAQITPAPAFRSNKRQSEVG